ncbi:MAG TPA: hypothetical protein VMQ65_08965 [Candidatus Limnocylindria bacterium]|nr:hypothetical protein [Candidatus Limnocylindria bacterium]
MMPGDPISPSDPIKPGGAVGWDPGRPAFAIRWLPTLGILAGLAVIFVIAGLQPPGSPGASVRASSPVDGVVVAVESEGLGQVQGFVLRLPDSSTITFTLGPLENASEFSPSHLSEHFATSEPIRAYFRLENGSPVAYRLEDAPPPASATPGAAP